MCERNEQRSRRSNPFRDLAQKLDGHGANPLAFELGCDQAHGLVTHGSDGNEQRDVDSIG